MFPIRPTNHVPRPPPCTPRAPPTSLTVDEFQWGAFLPQTSRTHRTVREHTLDVHLGAPSQVYRFSRTCDQAKVFGNVHRSNGGFSYRHAPLNEVSSAAGSSGAGISDVHAQPGVASRGRDSSSRGAAGASSGGYGMEQSAGCHYIPPRSRAASSAAMRCETADGRRSGAAAGDGRGVLLPPIATTRLGGPAAPSGPWDPDWIELRKVEINAPTIEYFAHKLIDPDPVIPNLSPRLPSRALRRQRQHALDSGSSEIADYSPPIKSTAESCSGPLPTGTDLNRLFHVPLPKIKKKKNRLKMPGGGGGGAASSPLKKA